MVRGGADRLGSMKTIRLAVIFVGCMTTGWSHWIDLQPAMNRADVLRHCGQPLLVSRARGLETWVYDHGGQVTFVRGQIAFFKAPFFY